MSRHLPQGNPGQSGASRFQIPLAPATRRHAEDEFEAPLTCRILIDLSGSGQQLREEALDTGRIRYHITIERVFVADRFA